jgi:hypothetical protein
MALLELREAVDFLRRSSQTNPPLGSPCAPA